MGSLFVCGASNHVLLPFLDKTLYSPPRYQASRSLAQLLNRYKLIVSWRESNPRKRNYTYFSNPHQTFSHIDHIFVTIGMVPELIASNIIPIPWSNHNAIFTSIASILPRAHDRTWYLPDVLIKHPSYRLPIEKALTEYLEHNTNTEIPFLTLWEAHKPVLRGVLQQQLGVLKREHIALARHLETEFNTSYIDFQNNPTPKAKVRLEKARLEYDLFLSESANKSLHSTKHAFYMKSNKNRYFLSTSAKIYQ